MTSVKRWTIFLAVSVLTAVSCENFYNDDEEYEEVIAMVESVTIDTVVNRTATITFTCPTPTPCWSFSRVAESRQANDIRLTVYRKLKKNVTCIQIVSSFKQSMNISVPAAGAYTLKIYRTPATTMDTTIVF